MTIVFLFQVDSTEGFLSKEEIHRDENSLEISFLFIGPIVKLTAFFPLNSILHAYSMY